MKRLSIVLGTIGFLAGCGQILGLGDYEVGKTSTSTGGSGGGGSGGGGSGGGGSGGDAGSSGNAGNAGSTGTGNGTGGGGNGGSAGDDTGGTGGIGGTTSTTTMGTGGSAGAEPCDCDERDPCMTSECQAGQCVPQPLGTECLSGNFAGVCDDEQECVPCVDDADDTQVDSGCPDTAPECDDTGATPECTGCMEDMDCDDGLDCTTDTCDDGRCVRSVLPVGSECSDGVCNGTSTLDSCVSCLDNQATGLDAGCEAALPLCDTSVSPPVCVECLASEDCNDDNDCTSETCESKACASETVAAGEECSGGICSGIAGTESCGACLDTAVDDEVDQGCAAEAPVCNMAQVPPVCTGCTTNTDCDDEIDCTTDTCDGSGVCVHTPDHGLCEASGDVCTPNQCVPGTGCTPVDVTESLQLLADANFDSDVGVWVESSIEFIDKVIVDEAGYIYSAQTAPLFAWLGGAYNEETHLNQVVSVPEGTQSLTFTFWYYVGGDDLPNLPDYNTMGAQLLSSNGNTVLYDFQALDNLDETNEWVQFEGTIDATEWAGTDVQVHFWALHGPQPLYTYYYDYYPYYYDYYVPGITNYFVDTTSLTASVCQ